MLCPKCGFENPDGAKFCGKCGTSMTIDYRTEPQTQIGKPPFLPDGAPVSSGLKTGIIVGTLFIPLLGIIMGIIYMNDPNPAKKAVGRLWLWVGISVCVLSCICGIIACVIGMSGSYY
ncbi:MAG: zinc-ribbon domain-containing protein [bacterium]